MCYNGNLFNTAQIQTFSVSYPSINAVMLGRGLIADPGMLCPNGTDSSTLKKFHDELLDSYTEAFGGSRNAMFRLKENWHYLAGLFEGSEKLAKQLRKTTDLGQYKQLANEIFQLPQKPIADLSL